MGMVVGCSASTLLPSACIGIVGTLRTTWWSASAKEHQHHPRGKCGNKDARRRAVEEAPATGRPVGTGRQAPDTPAEPQRADVRPRPDDRCPCTRSKRADVWSGPDDRRTCIRTNISGSPMFPDVRHPHHRAELADVRRTPDDRPLLRDRTTGHQRTSGTRLRPDSGPRPMYPYFRPHLHLDYK